MSSQQQPQLQQSLSSSNHGTRNTTSPSTTPALAPTTTSSTTATSNSVINNNSNNNNVPALAQISTAPPDKEGYIKKRGARMHRYSQRYFILAGSNLSYKIKQDSPIRGSFDLVAGCILTDVEEDPSTVKSKKKLYSFWLVWPDADKAPKESTEQHDSDEEGDGKEKDKEKDKDGRAPSKDKDTKPVKESEVVSAPPQKKDLKQIVENEAKSNREMQKKAEEQLEKHHAQDSNHNLSLGMKVAAVAVGGVVVGALTAGIGLVPYITMVGITAMASGGLVAMQYRRPSDSRLILACDTQAEAIAWRSAIEEQILKLQLVNKPLLPAAADPTLISHILGITSGGGGWKKVAQIEGIRIMEQLPDLLDDESLFPKTVCRKAQIIVNSCPLNVFLALMETSTYFWPKNGDVKVVQAIDDHADVLGASTSIKLNPVNIFVGKYLCNEVCDHFAKEVEAFVCFSRFWKLDDDGSYLITYNSTQNEDFPPKDKPNALILPMDAVITISPRRDFQNFEDDLTLALVTCTIQIPIGDPNWNKISEISKSNFMNGFVSQILDLRESLILGKFDFEDRPLFPTAAPPTAKHSKLKLVAPLSNPSTVSTLGVTTMQPGMEHIGDIKLTKSSSNEKVDPNRSQTPKTVPPTLSRKTTDDKKVPVEKLSVSPPSGTNRKGSINRLSSSGNLGKEPTPPSPKVSRRQRTKQVNAEASALRSQIASKEFEFARLDRMIRKKAEKHEATSHSPQKHPPSTTEDSPLKKQANDLLTEIKELKVKYFQLTGEMYEQSRREKRRIGTTAQGKLNETNTVPSNIKITYNSDPMKGLQKLPASPSSKAAPLGFNNDDRFLSFEDQSKYLRTLPQPPHWVDIILEKKQRLSTMYKIRPQNVDIILIALLFSTILPLSIVFKEFVLTLCHDIVDMVYTVVLKLN